MLPYRVDENYNANKLKIEIIKEEIGNSSVCLAEITEDNPNVWYELGFADGHDIPVVLICDKAKRATLPFDVNQRDTYFYDTENQDDWSKLQKEITRRLKIAVDGTPVKKINNPVPEITTDIKGKFKEAELFILNALYYGVEEDSKLKFKRIIREQMKKSEFSSIDITDAFNKLKLEKMIDDSYAVLGENFLDSCFLTTKGRKWCSENNTLLRK